VKGNYAVLQLCSHAVVTIPEISVVVAMGDVIDGVRQMISITYITDSSKHWLSLFSTSVPNSIANHNYMFDSGKKCFVYGSQIRETADVSAEEIQKRLQQVSDYLSKKFKELPEKNKNLIRSDFIELLLGQSDATSRKTFNELLQFQIIRRKGRVYSNFPEYKKANPNATPILVDSLIMEDTPGFQAKVKMAF
jgi:hypothetical protein